MENVKFRLTFHIKLVSFKNIDIGPVYGSNSIIFGAYIYFAHNTANIYPIFIIKNYVSKILVATIRLPQNMVLSTYVKMIWQN